MSITGPTRISIGGSIYVLDPDCTPRGNCLGG